MSRSALPIHALRTLPPDPLPEPGAAMPTLGLLRPGRVHEVSGEGRRAFAAALAGRLSGPVLWVQESRVRDRLCPPGLAGFLDPGRLVLVAPAGRLEVLQVLEEALRSGAVPLVVGELDASPDLTAGRRLQLAAGTGGGRGLVLVPEGRIRASAAETRWHCQPQPAPEGTTAETAPQLWDLVKNKRGRLGAWAVARGEGGFRALAPAPAHGAA